MSFKPEDVAEFHRLDALIRQKEPAEKEYNQLQDQLEVLDQKLIEARAKLTEYEKQRKKKPPSSPSGIKKLFGKGKDAKTDNVVSEGDALQASIAEIEKSIEELETKVAGLLPAYEEYVGLCEHEKLFLDRVFAEANAGPDEQQLAQWVFSVKPEFDYLHERLKSLRRAAKMMKEAHRLSEASLRRLDQALYMGQGDMFMSLMPGNEGMDIMLSREKRKHVSAAETGLTNCSKVVDKARALIPEIQPVDPAVIQALNKWVDMLAGSFIIDMVVQQQLDQSYARVQAVSQHLEMGKRWVEDREREASARYDQIAPTYKVKRKELYALRRAMLTGK